MECGYLIRLFKDGKKATPANKPALGHRLTVLGAIKKRLSRLNLQ